MKLTTEMLQKYVGGQLEIQNPAEDYLYRGEIAAVEVIADHEDKEHKTLKVKLAWSAKMGEDGLWHSDNNLDYAVSLLIYFPSDVGGNRISLNCPYNGERATFFPPDGTKLDRSEVLGLEPAKS